MSQTHNRYHGLDSLRSLAIGLVILWHHFNEGGPSWLYQPSRFGWSGVDLFFVLSGFLIGSQLLAPVAIGKAPSLKEFYIKRFFRILPNYYTVLALYLLIPAFSNGEAMPPLWKFLTFTQNFNTYSIAEPAFDHVWSLCIEEHFYLILPITIVLLFKKRITTRGALLFASAIALLGVVLRAVSHHHFVGPLNPAVYSNEMADICTRWVSNPTYNRLDGLLMGVLLAATYRLRKDIWSKLENSGNALFLGGTVFLAIGFAVSLNPYSFIANVAGYPLISIGYAAWVAAAMSKNCIVFKVQIPGTQTFALWAFAIYLLDKPILHVGHKLAHQLWGLPASSNITLAFTLTLIFASAWILHTVVEKPMLQLRDRVLAKL